MTAWLPKLKGRKKHWGLNTESFILTELPVMTYMHRMYHLFEILQ